MRENDRADGEPDVPPPSPARAEVAKWLTIWDYAHRVQQETGRHGDLQEWDAAWDFANHAAETTSPELVQATCAALRGFAGFLETLEWITRRLESLVPECTPEAAGAVLAAADGSEQGATPVRSVRRQALAGW